MEFIFDELKKVKKTHQTNTTVNEILSESNEQIADALLKSKQVISQLEDALKDTNSTMEQLEEYTETCKQLTLETEAMIQENMRTVAKSKEEKILGALEHDNKVSVEEDLVILETKQDLDHWKESVEILTPYVAELANICQKAEGYDVFDHVKVRQAIDQAESGLKDLALKTKKDQVSLNEVTCLAIQTLITNALDAVNVAHRKELQKEQDRSLMKTCEKQLKEVERVLECVLSSIEIDECVVNALKESLVEQIATTNSKVKQAQEAILADNLQMVHLLTRKVSAMADSISNVWKHQQQESSPKMSLERNNSMNPKEVRKMVSDDLARVLVLDREIESDALAEEFLDPIKMRGYANDLNEVAEKAKQCLMNPRTVPEKTNQVCEELHSLIEYVEEQSRLDKDALRRQERRQNRLKEEKSEFRRTFRLSQMMSRLSLPANEEEFQLELPSFQRKNTNSSIMSHEDELLIDEIDEDNNLLPGTPINDKRLRKSDLFLKEPSKMTNIENLEDIPEEKEEEIDDENVGIRVSSSKIKNDELPRSPAANSRIPFFQGRLNSPLLRKKTSSPAPYISPTSKKAQQKEKRDFSQLIKTARLSIVNDDEWSSSEDDDEDSSIQEVPETTKHADKHEEAHTFPSEQGMMEPSSLEDRHDDLFELAELDVGSHKKSSFTQAPRTPLPPKLPTSQKKSKLTTKSGIVVNDLEKDVYITPKETTSFWISQLRSPASTRVLSPKKTPASQRKTNRVNTPKKQTLSTSKKIMKKESTPTSTSAPKSPSKLSRSLNARSRSQIQNWNPSTAEAESVPQSPLNQKLALLREVGMAPKGGDAPTPITHVSRNSPRKKPWQKRVSTRSLAVEKAINDLSSYPNGKTTSYRCSCGFICHEAQMFVEHVDRRSRNGVSLHNLLPAVLEAFEAPDIACEERKKNYSNEPEEEIEEIPTFKPELCTKSRIILRQAEREGRATRSPLSSPKKRHLQNPISTYAFSPKINSPSTKEALKQSNVFQRLSSPQYRSPLKNSSTKKYSDHETLRQYQDSYSPASAAFNSKYYVDNTHEEEDLLRKSRRVAKQIIDSPTNRSSRTRLFDGIKSMAALSPRARVGRPMVVLSRTKDE